MEKSKLIRPIKDGGKRDRHAGKDTRPDPFRAWAVLGWIGVVFLLVGGTDFLLAWFPLDLGTREWEFGTVTGSFDGLPIVLLGVGALLSASVQIGRRWWTVASGVVAGVLLLTVVSAFVLWLTNVPLALQSVPAEAAVGLKKALVKTLVQGVTYPLVLAYLFWRAMGALRGTAGKRRAS